MLQSYFFTSAEDSITTPVPNRRTARLEPAFYATQQIEVTWNYDDWVDVPRPEAFIARSWPPISLTQLTAADEFDIPCFHCLRPEECNCPIDAWRRKRATWTANVLQLDSVAGPGSGVFSKYDLCQDSVIGEITGRLIPYTRHLFQSESHNLELTEFLIGYFGLQQPGKSINAVIDSFEAVSIMKFLNHSCSPNCEIVSGRVGKTRGVFVRALRSTEAGEELTIQMSNCMGNPYVFCRNPQCNCGLPLPPGIQRIAAFQPSSKNTPSQPAAGKISSDQPIIIADDSDDEDIAIAQEEDPTWMIENQHDSSQLQSIPVQSAENDDQPLLGGNSQVQVAPVYMYPGDSSSSNSGSDSGSDDLMIKEGNGTWTAVGSRTDPSQATQPHTNADQAVIELPLDAQAVNDELAWNDEWDLEIADEIFNQFVTSQ